MIVGKDQLTAELAFKLYESYGFPFELSIEEAKSRQLDLEVGLEEKIAERRQAARPRANIGRAAAHLAHSGASTCASAAARHTL